MSSCLLLSSLHLVKTIDSIITDATMFSQFKIVRLTGPIFHASETELAAFAAQGLPVTLVDAAEADALIPLVQDADIVAVVGTKLPTRCGGSDDAMPGDCAPGRRD